MITEERAAEIERRLDALEGKKKVKISVHVNGGSGDDHIRELARRGAQEAISECNEVMTRGGFVETRRRTEKRIDSGEIDAAATERIVQQTMERLFPAMCRDYMDRKG